MMATEWTHLGTISSPAGGGARRAEGDSVFITAAIYVSRDRVPLRPYGPPPLSAFCGAGGGGKRFCSYAISHPEMCPPRSHHMGEVARLGPEGDRDEALRPCPPPSALRAP